MGSGSFSGNAAGRGPDSESDGKGLSTSGRGLAEGRGRLEEGTERISSYRSTEYRIHLSTCQVSNHRERWLALLCAVCSLLIADCRPSRTRLKKQESLSNSCCAVPERHHRDPDCHRIAVGPSAFDSRQSRVNWPRLHLHKGQADEMDGANRISITVCGDGGCGTIIHHVCAALAQRNR